MGKASTSKTVARAARAGGSKTAKKRTWTFPAAIVAIVLIGMSIAYVARSSSQTSSQASASESPKVGDHWHAAYGVYVCDKFLPPVTDVSADVRGIHTHGDGIMHVHPFAASAAGKKAQFKVFSDTTNLTFQSHGFTMPDGTVYSDGYDCNGQPATVKVYEWVVDDPNAAPTIYTQDFGDIRFTQDRLAFTIAVVPEGTDVPKPDSIPELDKLTDVASTTQSTVAATPSTAAAVSTTTASTPAP